MVEEDAEDTEHYYPNLRDFWHFKVLQDVSQSSTSRDLLEALVSFQAVGGDFTADVLSAGVVRLCRILGIEETGVGRWSALTVDKAFQAGALMEQDQEASKIGDLLAEATLEAAPRISPPLLAEIIDGLAAAGLYNLALLRSAEQLLEPELNSLDSEVIAALLVAWAEADLRPTHGFLEGAAEAMMMGLDDRCSPDMLTSMLLGCAKLNHCDVPLLDAVAKAVIAAGGNFSAFHLSYVLWSYASLGVTHPRLLDHATSVLVLPEVLQPLNAHALTVSCWAFAELGYYDSMTAVLLDGVAEVLISDTDAFGAKDVSRVMWTFAQLRHMHPRMLEAVKSWAAIHLDEFDSRGLTNLVWGAACVDDVWDNALCKLLESIGAEASSKIDTFSVQDMASLLHGYCWFRYFHLPLLCAIEDHLHANLGNLPPKQLARLIVSIARINHRPSSILLEELEYFVSFNLPKMEAKAAVDAVWGIGVLGSLTDKLYQDFSTSLAQMDICDFEVRSQVRLIYIEMMARRNAKLNDAEVQLLPENVREEALETARESVMYTNVLVSGLKRGVTQTLLNMGISHRSDVVTADGCIRIDLAFDYLGTAIALETAERRMYSVNSPYHKTGNLLLREQLLEAEGWKVVTVSVQEWEQLPTSASRIAFLQRRLDLAAGIPSAEPPPPVAPSDDLLHMGWFLW